MVWAAFVKTAKQFSNGESRVSKEQILPSGSKILVKPTNEGLWEKNGRHWLDAIYLHPSQDVPNASYVALIEGGKIISMNDFISIRPVLEDVSTPDSFIFPSVNIIPTKADKQWKAVEYVECVACGLKGKVLPSVAKQVNERGFECQMLRGAECNIEGDDTSHIYRLRRGRRRKNEGEQAPKANGARVSNEMAEWLSNSYSALTASGSGEPGLNKQERGTLADEIERIRNSRINNMSKEEAISQLTQSLLTFDDKLDDLLTHSTMLRASVASNCTREERMTDAAKAARKKEMERMMGYSAWGDPLERKDAKIKCRGATLTKCAMLEY